MSGVGFSEFLILLVIGLIVLGPRRLPQVASQIGNWVGQARRMTRVMKRQLEDELDFDKDLNIGSLTSSTPPSSHPPPRDDDTFSPMHSEDEAPSTSSDAIDLDTDGSIDDERDEFDVEPDFEPAEAVADSTGQQDKKPEQEQ